MEFIQALDFFVPLFQVILAFFAVLTGLGVIFNLLLRPLKENQAKLESKIDKLDSKIDNLITSLIKKD